MKEHGRLQKSKNYLNNITQIYTISMQSPKKETPSTNIDQRAVFSSFLKTPNALDTIITFLSKLEREIIILFITKKSKLTAKHVERIIQSAYLFNAADFVIKEELKKGHKITKLLFKDAPFFSEFVYYFYAVARCDAEETYYGIEPPKDIEIPEEDTHLENLTRFFMADKNTSAEIKRLKLITEANKVKKHMIPSNTKINAVLSGLTTQGYIIYTKEGNKTLFFINPDFFDVWVNRKDQLLEEFFDEREAEKGDTQTTNLDLKQSLKKMVSNLNKFSFDEIKKAILKKYGPIIYEFFFLDTAYFDDKESLLILKYGDEIATYTPY